MNRRRRDVVYVGHPDIRKKDRQQAEREARRAEGEATDADVARIIAAQRKRDLKAAKRAGRPPIT